MEQKTTMTKQQLVKSVLLALFVGILVFVVAVLPAEFGKDPLGTGKLFGFDKLYIDEAPEETIEIKTNNAVTKTFKKLKLEKLGSPPSVPKPKEAFNPPSSHQYKKRHDTINVIVPAGKGIEYKFKTLKEALVKYDWATDDGTIVYIDFHGEVYQENPPKNVFYESYTLAYSNNMAGTFTASFRGKHGWYFRNESKKPVNVTLRLKGQYELFEQ